jgi:hypothetical protein
MKVASPFQRQLEVYSFRFLQGRQDAGEVCGRGTALWTQHPHEAFGRNLRAPFKILKPDGRVHIVAEHGLSGFQIAVDDALDGFSQERLAEIRIALRPSPDGFFEVVSKAVSCVVCSQPSTGLKRLFVQVNVSGAKRVSRYRPERLAIAF